MDEKYYVVRTIYAGVFFGQIAERKGDEVTMTNLRRLWSWNGATECCQLAAEGVSCPADCKFTMVVPQVVILGVIEIHPCTDKARELLKGVKVWKA